MNNERFTPSDFDSERYHLKVGRLDDKVLLGDYQSITDTLKSAQMEGYDTLFVRVNSDAQLEVEKLNQVGARNLSTIVTLRMDTIPEFRELSLRPGLTLEYLNTVSNENDVDTIAQISSNANNLTHLAKDPRLSKEGTEQIYGDWARNDCLGRAQQTILARLDRELVAFETVLIHHEQEKTLGIIDLVAVREDLRGQGIGTTMVEGSLWWLYQHAQLAQVTTEADNPSLRLYQRFGFVPRLYQNTYHLWLDESSFLFGENLRS